MEDLRDHARKLEAQFQLYVISLIFTLLAASVQTADLGQSKLQDVTEIAAWACLLLGGLLALSYAEWSPVIHRQIGTKHAISKSTDEARALRRRPLHMTSIERSLENALDEEQIARNEKYIEQLDSKVSELGGKNQKKYDAAKYLFISGLFLVLFSRSASAVASLFGFDLL